MSLLQMNAAGAIMILAITVIRALALERLPKCTFLVLWGVALARLLLPFSLPSPLSVYIPCGHRRIREITAIPCGRFWKTRIISPSVRQRLRS